MKIIKQLLVLSILLFLIACGNEGNNKEGIELNSKELTEKVEEIESEEVDWKDATGDIDFSEGGFEEIPWEDIHLSKAEFDDFLNEMTDSPFEVAEDDETEVELEVFNIDFDGEVIEYTITSVDEDDFMNEYSQAMYILMLDGFTRQLYLHSDYSNGEDQPTIIFYDEEGLVITENNDFIGVGVDEE